MKVYIGPYRNTWWTTTATFKKWIEWNHKKDYYSVHEAEHTKWDKRVEKFLDWWHDNVNVRINNLWIKKRKRKISVRIDNYDVWNADYTIALVVLPLLKKLKETKHGCPFVDDEDVPEHLRSTAAPPKENEWDTDDLFEARWEYVLDEMIHAFECTVNLDWEDQFYSGEHDIVWKDTGDGYKEMTKGPKDTFEIDSDGMKAAWKRRHEGLRLFAKYYHGLWD